MPMFKVAVMIVWLSNADGSIVAHSSGIAVDVRVAAEKIAEESGNPGLAGSTAHFSCWNTRSRIRAAERKPARGAVEL